VRCERTLKRSLRGALAFGPLIGRSFIFIRASWTLSTRSPSLKLPLSCKHNSLAVVLLLLLLYTFDRHQVYRLPEIINRSCVVYTAALPRGFRHRYVVRTFRFIIYTASPTVRCKFNFIFITVILHFSFPFQLSAYHLGIHRVKWRHAIYCHDTFAILWAWLGITCGANRWRFTMLFKHNLTN